MMNYLPRLFFVALLLSTHQAFPQYSLNILYSGDGNGTVTAEPKNNGTYSDQQVTLTADPNSDCDEFDHWSSPFEAGCTGNSITCTLFMDANKRVEAYFNRKSFQLNINHDHGQVVQSPHRHTYNCGSKVKLTAEREQDSCYQFVRWEGVTSSEGDSATVEMDQEKTVTAVFEKTPLTITPNVKDIAEGNQDEMIFQVSGGQAPYTWTFHNDAPEYGSQSVTYTAPETPGKYLITVEDSCDKTGQATVNVYGSILLLPQKPEVNGKSPLNLTVQGGKPPYVVDEVTAGNVSLFTDEDGDDIYNFTYTAPPVDKEDQVTLIVRDDLGRKESTVIIIKEALPPLVLSSEKKTLAEKSQLNLTVQGGKPPYSIVDVTAGEVGPITDENSDGIYSLTYTAPSVDKELQVTLTVRDALGEEDSAEITIKPIIIALITNVTTQIELEVEETKTFTVEGGTENYTWTVQGGGTIDKMTGSQVIYTAPDYPGSFQVVVTDGKETQQIQVNVTDSLRLYPNQVDLNKGQQLIFKVLGGKGPYQFNFLGGTGQIAPIDGEPDSVLVTAPNALGEFVIEVYDESLAKTAQATLNIVEGPLLSPKEVEVTQIGVPKNIEIQQGSPPFTVLVDKGEAKLVGRQVQISPPVENGTYKLTVRDAIGGVAEADINVKIPGRLEISPSQIEVELGGTTTFSAIGGQGPYTFISSKGGLSCNQCRDTDLTASGTNSDIILHVTDSTGAQATAFVEVLQPIRLVPSERTVAIYSGESKRFKITGGSGIYYYSTDFARAENTLQETNKGELIFTAPKYSGEVTLTVTDTRDSEPAVVKFNVSPIRLGLMPSILSLDMGSTTQKFEIISGEPNQRFKVWTDNGIANHNSNTILYTPPSVATTDKLYVFSLDTGEQITADIEIVKSLSISPAVMYLDNSSAASKVFHVSGGTGTYQFSARDGTFEPQFADASETGVDVTYKSSGIMKTDEQITVTDSRGQKHSAIVRINNQLRMTPEMVTLAPGAEVDFTGIHGVAPYKATVTKGNVIPTHAEAGEARFRYTAPAEAGEYQITVVDASDKEVTGTIFVTADLTMTATLAVLRMGESTTITANGGTEPYSFDTTFGHLSETDTSGEVRYTAPVDFEGAEMMDYVKATDSNGKQVSTQIRVIKTPKSEMTANSTSFVEGDNLKLNLTVLGQGQFDAYAAVFLPNGQLLFFGENDMISDQFIPYRQNWVLSGKATLEPVFSIDQLLDLGVQGQAFLYSLLVEPGTPPTYEELLNSANWLCDNECGLSELKIDLQ